MMLQVPDHLALRASFLVKLNEIALQMEGVVLPMPWNGQAGLRAAQRREPVYTALLCEMNSAPSDDETLQERCVEQTTWCPEYG